MLFGVWEYCVTNRVSKIGDLAIRGDIVTKNGCTEHIVNVGIHY